MYFKDCKTIDEAKTLFRKLCLKLHPDKGGTNAEFIKMFNEFENFKPQTDKFKQASNFDAGKFYDLIQKFEGLNDIKISFVGSFIWLEDLKEGAMYAQREQIKNILIDGYNTARWARKKVSWYYSPKDYKKKSKKRLSMDDIKSLYGSQEFEQRKVLLK